MNSIDTDYPNDPQAKKRLTIIMNYFYDDSYEIVKQIYDMSPEFIRFCYKALGIRHEYKITLHDYGFRNTPHTAWTTVPKDRAYVKEILFETAFRMLQQTYNGFRLVNDYNFIKHVNTSLSICRVCEICLKTDQGIMLDLTIAKQFYLTYLRNNLQLTVYDELYDLATTDNDIYTCIYFYSCVYGVKYDDVDEDELRSSFRKLVHYNTMVSQQTLDDIEHAIDLKYDLV